MQDVVLQVVRDLTANIGSMSPLVLVTMILLALAIPVMEKMAIRIVNLLMAKVPTANFIRIPPSVSVVIKCAHVMLAPTETLIAHP